MEDKEIINLFCNQSETAVAEIMNKYGRYIYLIGLYITGKHEDAEECLNDSLLILWRKIPSCRPVHLFAYIHKIAYRVALGKKDYYMAGKRSLYAQESFEENEFYIETAYNIDTHIEKKGIITALRNFYTGLSEEKRRVFTEKYMTLSTVDEIAAKYGMSVSKVKMMLFRMRKELKGYLEEENIYL